MERDIDRALRESGITRETVETYPADDDDLPEFGGPAEGEDEDEDWAGEFDDDDPYGDDLGKPAAPAKGGAEG